MHRRYCLFLVVLLSSCGSPRSEGPSSGNSAPTQAETQVAELQGKITKWQSNRDKLKKLLEQMQKDKTSILEKLVQLGIKSENDLANSPKGQVLHGELKDIVKQIALYDKKSEDYDLAILKSESRVRSVARQLAAREAGVSDTELEELTRSMVTLDESLSSEKEPAVPIDLKETLRDELARYQQGPQTSPTAGTVASQGQTPADSPMAKPSEKHRTSIEQPVVSSERPGGSQPERQPTSSSARRKGDGIDKASMHSQLPSDAILVLTFENDTLRRENNIVTQVADLSARGVSGKVQDAKIVQGKVGNGLEVGVGRDVEVPGPFPTGNEPRTLAVWVKRRAKGKVKHVITYGNNAKGRVFGIMCASDAWGFYDNFGGLNTGISADEEWHHHCVVHDGTTLTYYFDSKVVASVSKSLNTDFGPLVVGACVDHTAYFTGVIDEVVLFNRAVLPAEVQRLHQMGENGISLADWAASSR